MTSAGPQHHQAVSEVSRRMLLRAGAGIAAMGVTSGWSSPCLVPNTADLFVFDAPRSRDIVIGVTFVLNKQNSSRLGDSGLLVRVHAGAESWIIRGAGLAVASSGPGRRGVHAFAGEIPRPSVSANAGRQRTAVIEVPREMWRADAKLDVWAEILPDHGSRMRVGSPLVAAILKQNSVLSDIYHRASPHHDRTFLSGTVERQIASMAGARGVVPDPEAYGRRIAAEILPDVISYSPLLPTGFSFSSRNGRHPADPVAAVVQTILGGALARGHSRSSVELNDRFPYFVTAAV